VFVKTLCAFWLKDFVLSYYPTKAMDNISLTSRFFIKKITFSFSDFLPAAENSRRLQPIFLSWTPVPFGHFLQ